MKIGITYDLREDYLRMGFTDEETAEFDKPDTIDAIDEACRKMGHETVRIGNIFELTRRLAAGERWDLVFNIAEGMYGLGRESQVPALLDAYRIPYTFSDPLVLALSLHKGMCKQVVAHFGVPTPDHITVDDLGSFDRLLAARRFPDYPLFAKPVGEGTGKGIDARSVVRSEEDLRFVVPDLIRRFHQPVLVEKYLPGREFTVGVVGTAEEAEVIGVLEIVLHETAEAGAYSYSNKADWEGRVSYRLVDDPEAKRAGANALAAWRALGCRDGGRLDLRSDESGEPNFIEVNPLAGINPIISDLPILCNMAGFPYQRLMERIVASAARRIPQVAALPGPRKPAASAAATTGSSSTGANATSLQESGRRREVAVVLHGEIAPDAPADELDTLHEAEALAEGLAELGYEPVRMTFTPNLDETACKLRELAPRFVWNIVESVSGKARLLHLAPSLLDHLGIPFTGARVEATFTTTNKVVAKQVMKSAGIPTPDWVTLDEAQAGTIKAAAPLIIKSIWEHASVGLDDDSIVHDLSQLAGKMQARKEALGGSCFAERFIDGREFNVALVTRPGHRDPEALPLAEMQFIGYEDGSRPRMVGYKAKWDESAPEFHNTVRTFEIPPEDAALAARLQEIAIQCWHAFGLAGYNRVDFRVDPQGNPFVLEVNTNPCISPDSGFTSMFRRAGLTLPQLMRRVIDECLAYGRV